MNRLTRYLSIAHTHAVLLCIYIYCFFTLCVHALHVCRIASNHWTCRRKEPYRVQESSKLTWPLSVSAKNDFFVYPNMGHSLFKYIHCFFEVLYVLVHLHLYLFNYPSHINNILSIQLHSCLLLRCESTRSSSQPDLSQSLPSYIYMLSYPLSHGIPTNH